MTDTKQIVLIIDDKEAKPSSGTALGQRASSRGSTPTCGTSSPQVQYGGFILYLQGALPLHHDH